MDRRSRIALFVVAVSITLNCTLTAVQKDAQPSNAVASTFPQSNQNHSPWWQDPQWWQAGLVVLGTVIAVIAFLSERRAVRLTQRADVLIEKVGMITPLPGDLLTPRFPPLGEWIPMSAIQGIKEGRTQLIYEGTITYVDVFGVRHTVNCAGTYSPAQNAFTIDRNEST
jgi:hypothetical protein